MKLFTGQCVFLLNVPRKYSDLCLLTCADERESLQRLVSKLTVQTYMKAESKPELYPAIELLKSYKHEKVLETKRLKQIHVEFLRKWRRASKNPKHSKEDDLIDDWYEKIWYGRRQEFELEVLPETQILMELKRIELEKFLQYFLRLLSIGTMAEPETPEASLALHCFMASES